MTASPKIAQMIHTFFEISIDVFPIKPGARLQVSKQDIGPFGDADHENKEQC